MPSSARALDVARSSASSTLARASGSLADASRAITFAACRDRGVSSSVAVTDAAILAVHTDGVVIVLRSGETEQRAAERAVDQLRRLGVRVFGAVLNAVSTASPDESYYLQYYYSYTPTGMATQSGWERLREGMSKVKFFD